MLDLNKIKIGYRTYKINNCLPEDEKLLVDGDLTDGNIDNVRKEINIDDSLDYEDKLNTMIHEILHGIEYTYGVDLGEDVVVKLSNGLTDVLINNKLEVKRFVDK